jgi:tetratricopeptide (TPR) repeat protein
LKLQGKLDDAVACYRRVVDLSPDFAEAHNNLAVVLNRQGKPDEAVGCCQRALELKPDFAEARSNLGIALNDQGKPDEAVASYRRALELKPDFAEAHFNLGVVLSTQGKPEEAIACYRRALELKPDYPEADYNLGGALTDRGNLSEAIACFRRALQRKPDFAEAHNNLGAAFLYLGKLDEAVACCRRALELDPDCAKTHNNLGCALRGQGKYDEAVASAGRAVELLPDFAEAHLTRAYTWLLTGDWQRAWPEYQWRWRTKDFVPRGFAQPLWDGEPLAGKTILLHAEQGLGDTIQFIRYASIVKQLGATVVVECPKSLLPLLEGCPGIDQQVARGDDLPAFDLHAPLLSVPGIVKTSVETIPAQVPYLFPRPALLEAWRQRLTALDGFKIGVTWQGNPTFRADRFRSIPLRCFAPLAEVPGVRLLSLQKGVGTEQLAEVRDLFAVADLAAELDEQPGSFVDTAAVMKNLDLVITSDTATAHLAGALGVPVWIALAFAADWRWLLDRTDSPWYPTMRLFRQRERGNWQAVFEEIRKALCLRLPSSRTEGVA